MGFYRIIKTIFKDILFKIPKKYLVLIIILLSMFLIKNNVKAASYEDNIDTDNLTFYDYIDISSKAFDTGIILTNGTRENHTKASFYMEFEITPNRYFDLLSINENSFANNTNYDSLLCQSQSNTSQWWFRFNRNWDYTKIFNINTSSKHEVFINLVSNYISLDGNILYDFGVDSNITNFFSPFSIALNTNTSFKALSYKIYYIDVVELLEGTEEVNILHRYYPASYIKQLDALTTKTYYGLYDNIDKNLLIFGEDANHGDIIDSPIPPEPEPEPQPPTSPDYTQNFENINNSINETNNFLQDTSVDSGSFDINATSIADNETIENIDLTFNSFLNTLANALNNTEEGQTITLYLPNFLSNSRPYTITIDSSITKTILNGVNIPGLNMNCYNLVRLFWYLTIGGYLIYFIRRIYTAIKDGEVAEDTTGFLKRLDNEYAKISMFMI